MVATDGCSRIAWIFGRRSLMRSEAKLRPHWSEQYFDFLRAGITHCIFVNLEFN